MKQFYKVRVVTDTVTGSCTVQTKTHWWSMWEFASHYPVGTHMSPSRSLEVAKERADTLASSVIVYEVHGK